MEKLLEQIDEYKKEISGFAAASAEAVVSGPLFLLAAISFIIHCSVQFRAPASLILPPTVLIFTSAFFVIRIYYICV